MFQISERLKNAGFKLEGDPSTYAPGDMGPIAGAHWKTRDPDGNVVYFDTTDSELIEQGVARELKRVFDQTLRQLAEIGAETACVDAFKVEVVDKFQT